MSLRAAACVLGMLLCSCAAVIPAKTVKPALREDTWISYDGKVMPWKAGKPVPDDDVRAVVITVHGLSGAALDFWMLEDEWPPKGIAVYGLQLRGMGNDPDESARGDVKRAEVWQRDLLTFHDLVRERHPGVPVFWYSESLGSLIALHAVVGRMGEKSGSRRPAGVIVSSPSAGLRHPPSCLRATMLRAMICAFPWMKVSLEKLAGVDDKDIRVTHDTTHGAQMAVTPHHVRRFSLRLLGGIDKMMRALPGAASRLTVPLLALASPNDVIANEQQVADFFTRVGSADKTIHWYRKSYHLLLHDVQRQEVLRDATRWVEQRAAGN